MQKALLISILVATVAIPIWAARERSAQKAFKKTFFCLLAFNALYVVLLKYAFFKLM
jgi:hypothetical protein